MEFAKTPGPVGHGPPAKAEPPGEPVEEALPTIPPVLGPADGSGPGVHNPFTVQAPGVDLPAPCLAKLAKSLNWKVS